MIQLWHLINPSPSWDTRPQNQQDLRDQKTLILLNTWHRRDDIHWTQPTFKISSEESLSALGGSLCDTPTRGSPDQRDPLPLPLTTWPPLVSLTWTRSWRGQHMILRLAWTEPGVSVEHFLEEHKVIIISNHIIWVHMICIFNLS